MACFSPVFKKKRSSDIIEQYHKKELSKNLFSPMRLPPPIKSEEIQSPVIRLRSRTSNKTIVLSPVVVRKCYENIEQKRERILAKNHDKTQLQAF